MGHDRVMNHVWLRWIRFLLLGIPEEGETGSIYRQLPLFVGYPIWSRGCPYATFFALVMGVWQQLFLHQSKKNNDNIDNQCGIGTRRKLQHHS